MKFARAKRGVIRTYSLGSCIGVTLYDAKAGVGGMIHIQLPEPLEHNDDSDKKPAKYARTGIPAFIDHMIKNGAHPSRMEARIAGGSKINDANNWFEIGQKNYRLSRKLIECRGIQIMSEDVGDKIPRTMTLHLDTGTVALQSTGRKWLLTNGYRKIVY